MSVRNMAIGLQMRLRKPNYWTIQFFEVIVMVKNSSSLQGAPSSQNDAAFSNLSGDASTGFNAIGTKVRYSRGGMLFSEGETPQYLFIVRSGRIKISVTSREGRTMILRIADAGHVLGLSATLSASQHELSAEALEPCCVTAV